jgi:hypothetical protein
MKYDIIVLEVDQVDMLPPLEHKSIRFKVAVIEKKKT